MEAIDQMFKMIPVWPNYSILHIACFSKNRCENEIQQVRRTLGLVSYHLYKSRGMVHWLSYPLPT